MHFTKEFWLTAAFALALAGCGCGCPDDEEELEPTLASIQENIFTPSCASSSCHGSARQGELDLRDGKAWEDLVNVTAAKDPEFKLVEPGKPDKSFLYIKLKQPGSGQGSRMPLGGSSLSSEKLAIVRQWIEKGAPK